MRTLVIAIALLATGSLALAEEQAAENTPAAAEPAAPAEAATEETLDLSSEPDAFAPYHNERHPAWTLLPLAAIAIVLLHLRKSKPQPKLVKGPQT